MARRVFATKPEQIGQSRRRHARVRSAKTPNATVATPHSGVLVTEARASAVEIFGLLLTSGMFCSLGGVHPLALCVLCLSRSRLCSAASFWDVESEASGLSLSDARNATRVKQPRHVWVSRVLHRRSIKLLLRYHGHKFRVVARGQKSVDLMRVAEAIDAIVHVTSRKCLSPLVRIHGFSNTDAELFLHCMATCLWDGRISHAVGLHFWFSPKIHTVSALDPIFSRAYGTSHLHARHCSLRWLLVHPLDASTLWD